ncbi:hypothetical protein ASU33_14780 [Solirubrum puertoriconensis]|uniref:Acyltransferase 3 domain-containing protein n=2 Tax=Solirubrum puertoriconensis TaxID=1751427 RepID=A0A9X0L4M1_SOLP1|nr:hypothetical protein ASU33_14780 [Solirubrum puertoriconensis]
MVYLHHYNPGLALFNSQTIQDICHEMHVGVTIFFTLSGFLITTRYYNHIHLSKTYVWTYFINRFARIYPLYILLTTLFYVLNFIEHGATIELTKEYVLNATFLRGFSYKYFCTGLPQGWSLTAEECFYVFALFFLVVLQSLRRTKWLAWVMASLLLPALGYGLVMLCNHLGIEYFENLPFVASYTFFGRFTEFFIGSGLAFLLNRNGTTLKVPAPTYLGMAAFAAGIFLLIQIKQQYNVNYGISHPYGVLVNNVYLPLCISLIFAGLLTEQTIISKLLSTNVFSVLGKSSYAFYLINMGFVHAMIGYFNEKTALEYSLNFTVLLLISIMAYYLIEEPVNKKIRSLTSRLNWLTPISVSSNSASSRQTVR